MDPLSSDNYTPGTPGLASAPGASGRGPPAVVLGAGVIGLSAARELIRLGWAVTVVEKGQPGGEASGAAAGMIAPRVEFKPGSWLWNAGLESKALYPAYAAELEAETGISVDLRLHGLLVPHFGGEVEHEAGYGQEGAQHLSGKEARKIEPALSERAEACLLYADEGSVDNRALVAALLESARVRGVHVLAATTALEVLAEQGRVQGVRTTAGLLGAELVVNALGAWAGQVKVPGARASVKPIKGHMLCVDTSHLKGRPLPSRVLYSHATYIVPRSDGRMIIGTTVEDRGFDKTVEAGAVGHLLDRAAKVWPGVAESRFVDAWTGLRPLGTEPEPRIGPAGPAGYVVAIGHYRNGILLTPFTARAIVQAVSGKGAQSSTEAAFG